MCLCSFTSSCYDLTNKAKNAILCIMHKLRMLNNSFVLFLKSFDSQVQPIALYRASDGVLRQQLFIAKKYIYLCWESF